MDNKKEKDNIKLFNKIIVYLSICLSSFTALLLCSKCSFLYPFNDWFDANTMFNTAKSMLHGKVLYVDLIDHRGFYSYVLFAGSYILVHKSFLGLFIFECISFFVFLFVIHKCIKLYTDRDCYFIYPLISFVLVSATGFVQGGSSEEFALPFIAYSIYLTLKLIKNRSLSLMEVLLAGISSGILFWTKFNLCASFVVWIIAVIATDLKEKKIKKLLSDALIYAAGCIASSMPCLIYFIANSSLYESLDKYIISNVFAYNNEVPASIAERIGSIFTVMGDYYLHKGNLILSFLLIAGIVCFMLLPKKKVSAVEKLLSVVFFVMINLAVFISGHAHNYYGFVSSACVLFAAIAVSILLEKIWNEKSKVVPVLLSVISLIIGIILAIRISDNIGMIKIKRMDIPQYKYAEIIEDYEDKSLMNYKILDAGVDTILGTDPAIKEYCVTNLNYVDIVLKQVDYIEQGKTNFVIAWYELPASEEEIIDAFPEVAENYELLSADVYYMEGAYRTFSLWIRK